MSPPSEREAVAHTGESKSQAPIALLLFVLTLLSVFWVGAVQTGSDVRTLSELWQGRAFALPFMAILVCHELGHYVAARLHGVDASLPFFLPMPLSPIGTLGAVIGMRTRIERRDALFDIGAAGPLAGLVVAVPVLAYGLYTSPVEALDPNQAYFMEGRSLLYLGLLYLLKGPIPSGHDVLLNPTAFAGWAGLLVTMMNLVPVGQLDGGHVSYALFGERQNAFSLRVRQFLFVFGGAMVVYGAVQGRASDKMLESAMASGSWLLWALLLTLLSRAFGGSHPPAGGAPLSGLRKALAWACLGLFVLLFMPRWLVPSL